MTVRAAGNNNVPTAIVAPSGAKFEITDKIIPTSCYFIKRK